MRSISCQTDNRNEAGDESTTEKGAEKEKKVLGRRLERSLSLREKKNKKMENAAAGSNFSRSQSMRFSDERGGKAVKDINLKTSDAHQDKDKGG
jgi:hypothetical protein